MKILIIGIIAALLYGFACWSVIKMTMINAGEDPETDENTFRGSGGKEYDAAKPLRNYVGLN